MSAALDCKLAAVRLEDFQRRGDILSRVGGYATRWSLAGLLVRPILEILEHVQRALRQRDSALQEYAQFCALWVLMCQYYIFEIQTRGFGFAYRGCASGNRSSVDLLRYDSLAVGRQKQRGGSSPLHGFNRHDQERN